VKELFLGETDGTTAGGADATNTTSATPPISRTAKQLINHEWLGELEMLLHYSKPTIAAVNGAAVGYGCDLALMCDLRVASDRARFGELFIKRGLIPEAGGLLVLPHLVGWEKAHELVLTGDLIDAEEALRIGMIGRVVAQRLAKEAFRIGRDGSIREFTDFQRNAQQLLFRTDDHREGARSFVEKREARFKGR
jgi:enoyl-CoA hydratase/carnithine racemase